MSGSSKAKPGKDIGPAEFTKRLPEGEGAGPDAPETLEPTAQPEGTGPGGPAMKGLGEKKADTD